MRQVTGLFHIITWHITRLWAPGYGHQVTHVTGYSKLQVPGYTFPGYFTGF